MMLLKFLNKQKNQLFQLRKKVRIHYLKKIMKISNLIFLCLQVIFLINIHFKNFINRNNYLYLISNPKENIDINDLSDWKLAKSYVIKLMRSKNVFLTGSEGFIGSHMVETLVKKLQCKALVMYNSFKNIGWLSDLDKKILDNVE